MGKEHVHGPAEPGRVKHDDGDIHQGSIFGEKTELIFSVLAGIFLLVGWLLEKSGSTEMVTKGCYLGSYFFGGYFALLEAIENIKNKKLKIDSLMIVAAIGAAGLGEWPEGALLLVLFSFGHALEHYAMGRARRAVDSLAALAPQVASVRRGNSVEEVPVEQLKVGDIVLVKSNERIPADGFVVKGESAVDQSAVTGESIPVDKEPLPSGASEKERTNARYGVFSGTINGAGSLEIHVTRISSESTLSKVIQMVNEAEAKKSPTQLFTDQFERVFVPSVLFFVLILPFAFLIFNEPWQASLYRALAVLVAASPCALAIATPSAVLSAVARAAKGGVLVKGGGPLEELGALSAIAFDKTGTLTEGKPEVTDVVAFDDAHKAFLISAAVALERMSDHPLAAAVIRFGESEKGFSLDRKLQVSEAKSITGKGISGNLNGTPIFVGKLALFSDEGGLPQIVSASAQELQAKGRTVMLVKFGQQFLGVFGLMDSPRKSAAAVIAELKQLGITKMVMLSGDNQAAASAVAKELGLSDAKGDLMPEDKVSTIKELRKIGKVAMVGDGVNDAPAMTQSNVGIAMGAAGSDVALQTADIALMSDDLSALPFAVGLSRKTRSIVRQNLWVSLGVVFILIPATLFGLKMGFAVIAHEGSTLLVVFNALRLLGFKKPVLR
ncbi:MAG: heavy metal translocating P-type ATPase [Bdellovibrionales bacterium]|nr:heavy metal translocating P-type ATPase [Bdellovibrionales bacterium]